MYIVSSILTNNIQKHLETILIIER